MSLNPPPSPPSPANPTAQVASCLPVGRADSTLRRNGAAASEPQRSEPPRLSPALIASLLETLASRWRWLVLGGTGLGLLGLAAGLLLWQSNYTAPAQLVRNDSPNTTDVFGYRAIAPQTFASLLRSPELLRRVAAQAHPPLSAEALADNLRVMPERNSDVIVLAVSGQSPSATLDLANLYAHEAVRFTQEMQVKSAAELNRFLTEQLGQVETEIAALNHRVRGLPPSAVSALTAPRSSALVEKLQTAREDLIDLLARYTDAHPLVQAQRAKVAALENQFAEKPSDAFPSASLASGGSPQSAASPTGGVSAPARGVELPPGRLAPEEDTHDPEIVRSKLQSLENARLTLLGRRRAAQSFEANPPGYYQLLAPATPKEVVKHGRKMKVFFLAAFMSLLGITGAAALVLFFEAMDDRLKNSADVTRVTRLPLLASAGDLGRMSDEEQANWGFRAWTHLQGRLSASSNHGLVCGVTSASHGEGRSTWVNLLARAASQRGFRVLTIATRPSQAQDEVSHSDPPDPVCPPVPDDGTSPAPNAAAIATSILATPAEVTQKLTGSDLQPRVHIPLPGWVWNLERRKQWQAALQHWSQIDNIVILVELPPAGEPEAVLLAENLPNLIWLADAGKARAAETCEQLETLRHARCRMAGTVVNHAPVSVLSRRFKRWLNGFFVVGALSVQPVHALEGNRPSADAQTPPANTNLTFSVVTPAKRAPWQERLTLGPGDLLNLSLFGQPELTRQEVPVGPDGRVSYLEAQDVLAAGLTIDEFRDQLNTELAKYRRAPRAMISPASFHSKKYFVLGGVVQKGVFTLDRPTTIIEAVARARGLETGLSDRSVVELADLSRTFLVRGSQRAAVDFEQLFQAGDLSQNIQLEPDDYLFFPARSVQEVYVLGEVAFPGVASFNPGNSVLGAITVRGGFNQRAWRKRVLVVRGSLNHPQTFIVDAADALAARAPDFKLEPGDIVYVSHRPWIKAEELLDAAASAFVQAAIITATGVHVGPFIR